MSTNIICMALLLLLLIAASPTAARHLPILPSAPSTALPAAAAYQRSTTQFTNHKLPRAFHRPEVKNCMPKGSRRNSAPSRYVNYHTFGSSAKCSGSQPPPAAAAP